MPTTLRSDVIALLVGQSLLANDTSMGSLKSTVSEVRRQHSEREYRCKNTPDGPRVWRLA